MGGKGGLAELWGPTGQNQNICIIRLSERDEKECGAEKIFEEILGRNSKFGKRRKITI